MSTTIPGGFYLGVDGKPHDAEGRPIVRGSLPSAPLVVEQIKPVEQAAPADTHVEEGQAEAVETASKGKAAKGR